MCQINSQCVDVAFEIDFLVTPVVLAQVTLMLFTLHLMSMSSEAESVPSNIDVH